MAGMRIGFKSRSATNTGGRIGGTIFFLIFALFGGFMGWLFARSMLKEQATHSWSAVPCRIESVSYDLPKNDRDGHKLLIRYAYSAGGAEYMGDRLRRSDGTEHDFEPIQRAMLQYPPGSESVCYVNPADPAEAVLSHASRWGLLVLPFPFLFCFIGVGGIWFTWRHRPTQSLSATAKKKSGGVWIGVLIGLVFLVAGTAFNAFLFAPALVRWVRAKSWPEVPATVLNSRVRVSDGDDSDTYAVDVLYRYTYDGREYLSNRYNFFSGSSSGRSGKQQVVSRLRRGTQVNVYVNPSDPVIAVIDRDLGWWMLFSLIPTVFMLVGGGITYASLRGERKGRDGSPASGPTRTPAGRARGAFVPIVVGDVPPLSYSSGASRWGKAIAIGLFALIWNGISWTIAVLMWRGSAGMVPLGFISLFLLIGLAVLAGFAHSVLAIFNPTLQLDLSHAPLRLGDTVTARWSFSGRFDRIHRLTIILHGREQATYRRGTTTTTDKKIFRTLDLVDTSKQVDIARGQVSFVIPTDTMHSFDASNNKIVWEMTVKGEISNWPDVKEEIKLEIRPHEGVSR